MSRRSIIFIFFLGMAVIAIGSLIRPSHRRRGLRRAEVAVAPQKFARSAGGDYATTDRYLSDLRIPSPSERIVAAFSELPPDDALVFVAPDRTIEIELVYRAVASLGWPHETGFLSCEEPVGAHSLQFAPRPDKKVKWLFYYSIKRRGTARGIEIGPRLSLIPVSETEPWTSYCSR